MATVSKPTTDDVSAKGLAAIERATQEVGRYLFEHLEVRRPNLWDRRWWDDRIMAWAMNDEAVKVQLFRFIDVLPMLSTPEAISQHLEEYLNDVRGRLPSAARFGLTMTTPTALGRRGLAIIARRNAMSHARRFIAGTDTQEVLAAALRERRSKRAFTLDVLGEAVTSDREADAGRNNTSTSSNSLRRRPMPGPKFCKSTATPAVLCRALMFPSSFRLLIVNSTLLIPKGASIAWQRACGRFSARPANITRTFTWTWSRIASKI
jgi:hypothetical protein